MLCLSVVPYCSSEASAEKFLAQIKHFELEWCLLVWVFACHYFIHADLVHFSFNFLHVSFSSASYTLCEYECVSGCTCACFLHFCPLFFPFRAFLHHKTREERVWHLLLHHFSYLVAISFLLLPFFFLVRLMENFPSPSLTNCRVPV